MEQKQILKESNTNNAYQSTFLPILQRAEIDIKRIIIVAFYNLTSKNKMILMIQGVIMRVQKDLPKELKDREQYISGLQKKATMMIKKYYDQPKVAFISIASLIALNTANKEPRQQPKVNTPKQLVQILSKPQEKKKLDLDMWTEAKATVRVENYPKKIREYINELSRTPVTTEQSEHSISLWQKAEIDLRQAEQLRKLQELKDKGVELAWISSHPNCSKRCEKWQGKLVSLNEHATMSGMRVKKVDGEWVYSLPDITDQVQYTKKEHKAYKNNIIVGFNCRHHLIPYTPGRKPPQEYSEKDVKRQREIETTMREMEREIRRLKEQYELEIATFGESSVSQELKAQIIKDIAIYKAYCKKNGYAWYQYRINI